MTKRKVFYIDGGAGRVIAAIHALEKYAKLHPDEDWGVLIGGWDSLVWGNPLLQNRTYNPDTKGIFDLYLKDSNIITPEPYRVNGYFNQKLSLAEAFDEEINQTTDHKDLATPKLILNKNEEKTAANVIADAKQQHGQKPITVVIQPFGRSARVDRGDVIDDSSRSLDHKSYLSLVKKLSTKYTVILFAENQFFIPEDTYTFKLQTDLRGWAGIVEGADYFVGCDSVGQHMARAFDKPGTVIVGSTFAINTTYPDYFKIYEKSGQKKYSPIRICGLDSHLADRLNDSFMDFNEKEIDELFNLIVSDIDKKVKVK
jgi:ADP-heptose:LPS heptosyltransferase